MLDIYGHKKSPIHSKKLTHELTTSESVLAYYDLNKQFNLVTGGCGESIGGILLQLDENGCDRQWLI